MERHKGLEELRRRRVLMARVFGSPDGQEALNLLIKEFGGSTYAKSDPYHTCYLSGARDLLLYVQEMTKEIP